MKIIKSNLIILVVLGVLFSYPTIQAVKVHSIGVMVNYPQLHEQFLKINEQYKSGLSKILGKEIDSVSFLKPKDMHLSLLMFEIRPQDWSDTIPGKVDEIVKQVLAKMKGNCELDFRRTALLPGALLLEYKNAKCFEDIKRALVDHVKKNIPNAVIGYENEYFPHISLAYGVKAEVPFDPIEEKPISTIINGQEIPQLNNAPNIDLNKKSDVVISHEFWNADFIKD